MRNANSNMELAESAKVSLFDQLIEKSRDGKIASFQSFVNTELPATMFSEKNYVLYRKSGALCKNDVKASTPRVVMIEPTDDLLVAFSGNKSGKCFGLVEMLSCRENGCRTGLIDFRATPPLVTDGNGECANCHTAERDGIQIIVGIWANGQHPSRWGSSTCLEILLLPILSFEIVFQFQSTNQQANSFFT